MVRAFGEVAIWAALIATRWPGCSPMKPARRSTLWSALSDRNPLMIEPISDEIVRSQQQLADRFHALGIIPTAIQVADERTTAQNANDSMPSTVACAAAPPAALSDSRNA
jgi:hypothetical protein